MSDRAAAFLLVVVCLWTPLRGAERSVSCLLWAPCTLPCSFDPGPEVVIHWLKPPHVSTPSVHTFYHGSDQLREQKAEYKGRTQLFKDQIPLGNASLHITGVRVTDKGLYKCYTSTAKGNSEDFINLDLEALVSAVSLSEDGEKLQCISTNLLPEPSVSWSPEPEHPPETITSLARGEWSVHSSVSLIHSPSHQYICNVSNSRSSWRSATYRRQDPVNASTPQTTLSCSDSRSPIETLIWTFNRTQTILNQTGADLVYSPDWETRAQLGSGSDLVLKDLNQDHQGLYSCFLSTKDQTYLTTTEVNVKQSGNAGLIVGVVIPVIIVLMVIVILSKKKCKKKH